ncbi:DUF4968 domain-containing protein [bacterium]|nr:DUF4968 domain-containing protein [bacterium]
MKQRITFTLLLLLLVAPFTRADRYTFLGSYTSHSTTDRTLTVQATNNVLKLTLVDSAIVRVQVGRDGVIQDIPSYAVVAGENPLLRWDIEDHPGDLTLRFPGGSIVLEKFPVRLILRDTRDSVLIEDAPAFGHAWDGKEVQVWKRLHDDERFYGLGEKTGGLNKRGSNWTMWNSDVPGYGEAQDPLYVSVPFFIGVRDVGAYGVFFDNSYRSTFNLGAASDRVFSFGAEDGEMNYYLFSGPALPDVVRQYTHLTGRIPLPPMWAFGNQQSRWSYYPEFEVRDIAQNFRNRKLPCDVIYLDIRYMDRFKVFTWDSSGFADPAALLADLEDDGFKIVPIIDPGVKIEAGYEVYEEGVRNGYFARYPDGQLYSGEVWPGWCHFPDFTSSTVRSWWGAHYADMAAMGVDGFWNDMNEPAVWGREFPLLVEFDDEGRESTIKKIHNVYGLLMARASYEGLLAARADTRPFILTRAGFAGSQRYAAVWTGDNRARWEDLRLALRMCQGLGLSGMAFCGPDIGGFIGHPTPELYVRWMQAAVFTPFMRTHSHLDTPDQSPWSFGEWSEDIARHYLNLRYEMLPYMYSEFHRASQDGTPFMRPLFYDFPKDAACYSSAWEHSFMAGPSLLVAPVVEAGAQSREVYLPPGRWIDAWTGESHEGGQSILVKAPMERLPYFYRAGAIIPRRNVQQYTGESPMTELILDIVPKDQARYTLYLDRGDGFGHLQGEFDEIHFSLYNDGLSWVIRTESSPGRYAAAIKSIRFRILGSSTMPRGVAINDEALLFENEEEREQAHVLQDVGAHRFEISLPFRTGSQVYRFEY